MAKRPPVKTAMQTAAGIQNTLVTLAGKLMKETGIDVTPEIDKIEIRIGKLTVRTLAKAEKDATKAEKDATKRERAEARIAKLQAQIDKLQE